MTDNEIKKALEDAINGDDAPVGECFVCCISKLTAKECVDLINRQQAEVEAFEAKTVIQKGLVDRHRAEIERLNKAVDNYECCLKKIEEIKTEAIKEFIKKLKEKKHECGCNYRKKPVYAITEEKIDETYKEMVGDAE